MGTRRSKTYRPAGRKEEEEGFCSYYTGLDYDDYISTKVGLLHLVSDSCSLIPHCCCLYSGFEKQKSRTRTDGAKRKKEEEEKEEEVELPLLIANFHQSNPRML